MPPCWRMVLHLYRNIYGVEYNVQNINQNKLKKTNDLRISIRINVRGLFTGYCSAAEADSTSDSNAARQLLTAIRAIINDDIVVYQASTPAAYCVIQ